MGLTSKATPALVLYDTISRRPIPIGTGILSVGTKSPSGFLRSRAPKWGAISNGWNQIHGKHTRCSLSHRYRRYWAIGGSHGAQAGVGDEIVSFFNDMGASANATGVAYQGQSAGYYSLGSVWARFPQKSVYPANIQLPKVRAGCGGIDIFSGSFSFINMAEFVANLKAIANNAIGFAFSSRSTASARKSAA